MQDLNFWDILLVFGMIQGVVLSVIIFLSKSNRSLSNTLIGCVLIVLTLAITGTFLDKFSFDEHQPFLRGLQIFFPFFLLLSIGPCIYLLVKNHCIENYHFSKSEYKHFYTVLLDIIPSLLKITYIISLQLGVSFLSEKAIGDFLSYYNTYGDVFLWVQLSFYLWLSHRLIKKNKINKISITGHQLNKQWLSRFIILFIGFQLVWLPFLIIYISPYNYLIWEYGIDYYYIYIPLIFLVYWIGFKWLLISREINILRRLSTPSSKTSYDISESSLQYYKLELEKLMNEKTLYLTPSLSVRDVAYALDIQPKLLSHILNKHLGTNFNDFINHYRIDLIKERLVDPNYNHLTIAALAFESGFTSVATFQRVFKNLEHISPSAYKQRLLSSIHT